MDISTWMREPIQIARLTGVDGAGQAVRSAPFSVVARVEREAKLVRNAMGEEVTISVTLYTLVPLFLTDAVWLPGTDSTKSAEARTPVALSASVSKDGGSALYKTYLA
jgi:hypothetical protein